MISVFSQETLFAWALCSNKVLEELDISQLNKLSPWKERNSLYGVFDCESDGNCFFHCIAHALNEKYLGTDTYYNSDDIRRMISDNLSEEQYDTIIEYYRIMKDADDFSDYYGRRSIMEAQAEIIKYGIEFFLAHLI